VLRRSNGYFIYSTVEGVSFQPQDIPVGPVALALGGGQVAPGIKAALVGARPGYRIRALIPPELGWSTNPDLLPSPPTFATKRQLQVHAKEPLLLEILVLRVDGQTREQS